MAMLRRGFGIKKYEPNVEHTFNLKLPSRSIPMWGEYQKTLQTFDEYQFKDIDVEPIDVKFFITHPLLIHGWKHTLWGFTLNKKMFFFGV
jgi:hypothetical protein